MKGIERMTRGKRAIPLWRRERREQSSWAGHVVASSEKDSRRVTRVFVQSEHSEYTFLLRIKGRKSLYHGAEAKARQGLMLALECKFKFKGGLKYSAVHLIHSVSFCGVRHKDGQRRFRNVRWFIVMMTGPGQLGGGGLWKQT